MSKLSFCVFSSLLSETANFFAGAGVAGVVSVIQPSAMVNSARVGWGSSYYTTSSRSLAASTTPLFVATIRVIASRSEIHHLLLKMNDGGPINMGHNMHV